MVIRKVPPTTAILNAGVITRCSVSTSMAISSGCIFATVIFIVPTNGGMFWSQLSIVIEATISPRFYRGDAGSADPNLYRYLEGKGYSYAIHLKANAILYAEVEYLLTHPVGRPPKKPIVHYYSFRYQAASWDRAGRVVAKVEWHGGELFPRVGFIVTNLRQ